MTSSFLDTLRALDAKATPGPLAIIDNGTLLSWSEMHPADDGSPPKGYRRAGLWWFRGGNVMCREIVDAKGARVADAPNRCVDGDAVDNDSANANAALYVLLRNAAPRLAALASKVEGK